MLRLPLYPIECFNKLNLTNDFFAIIRKYAQDEMVREAILVSSPSLYEALPNLNGELTTRKTKQTLSSFLRYALRMSTRATPFGLFAGIALGSMEEQTNISIKNTQFHCKRSRPDMEWLLGIIERLEQRLDVVKQLKVQRNHAVLQVGGRMELTFSTEYGQVKRIAGIQKERITIRATEVVHKVFKFAEQPILFEQLIARLLEQYPEAGEQKVTQLLWQLFSQEFLLSELRPPLTIASPFDYVIERLSMLHGVNEIYTELKKIQKDIKRYDELPIGEGIQIFQQLLVRMKTLKASDMPIQIDLRLASNQVCMNKKIGEEVAKAAECLWRLSFPQRGLPHLWSYHKDFLERYGTAREVPILELLSDEYGLGPPAGYNYPQSRREKISPLKQSDKREAILMEKVMQAILNRDREVEITNDLLDMLDVDQVDATYAPNSLEIYVEVIAHSQKAIDQGEYQLVIGPMPGSSSAGQSFGRFLDILGDGAIQKQIQIQKRQEEKFPDVIFVDASYMPSTGRSANVVLHPSISQYELAIGTNCSPQAHSILLDDIVVCATLENLYLKSRSSGKKIIVTANHMLNFNASPNIYRFLREVSMENVRSWQAFSWGNLDNAPFVPRVRYGKTILSPAIWRLNPSFIGLHENPVEDHLWYDAFSKWRMKWDVPKHVYMTFGDHRILLDLDNFYHLEELRTELFKAGRIQLREKVGGLEEHWINGQEGNFAMECVVPLLKHSDINNPIIPTLMKERVLTREQYIKIPGSDWLFLKLYGGQNRQEEFIVDQIHKFADSIVQKGAADEWFFMRYVDPDPHIRLRFHGKPEKLMQEVLPLLKPWIQECQKEGFIQKMMIDTYDREVERYGGPDIIADAESVFARDSQTSTKLLELLRYKQTGLPNYVLATISIIDIMTTFGLSFEKQLAWMEQVAKKETQRDDFRKWRKPLLSLADPRNEWQGLRDLPSGEVIREAFSLRIEALKKFGEKVAEGEKTKTLWNPPPLILGGLIHLHCNRLFGVNREMEEKTMAFVRHTLYSQLHWRGNVGDSIQQKH
ncbi:lantibiotic dehydratase [Brevibacillus laterosporus]|uniref:lantibiotic dehydratase n=1 Tax=Brevibacillus laterosporus TaxID=1465 RepID=UPI001F5AC16E|nr:lantibiotic dehydratase [Brevibacillus laterosporus]